MKRKTFTRKVPNLDDGVSSTHLASPTEIIVYLYPNISLVVHLSQVLFWHKVVTFWLWDSMCITVHFSLFKFICHFPTQCSSLYKSLWIDMRSCLQFALWQSFVSAANFDNLDNDAGVEVIYVRYEDEGPENTSLWQTWRNCSALTLSESCIDPMCAAREQVAERHGNIFIHTVGLH